jgi:hypothetical protein
MSFGDVAGAAIEFARDGFSIFPFLASAFEHNAEQFRDWPYSAAIFLPNGRPPRLGERFIQTDLAATIQFMVDEEKSVAHLGREAGLEAARADGPASPPTRQLLGAMTAPSYHLAPPAVMPRCNLCFRSFSIFSILVWISSKQSTHRA